MNQRKVKRTSSARPLHHADHVPRPSLHRAKSAAQIKRSFSQKSISGGGNTTMDIETPRTAWRRQKAIIAASRQTHQSDDEYDDGRQKGRSLFRKIEIQMRRELLRGENPDLWDKMFENYNRHLQRDRQSSQKPWKYVPSHQTGRDAYFSYTVFKHDPFFNQRKDQLLRGSYYEPTVKKAPWVPSGRNHITKPRSTKVYDHLPEWFEDDLY